MDVTACVLCGTDDTELMWMAYDLAFDGPGEFPLVRCRRCGLMYLRVRPTPQEIGRYYPLEYSPYRTAIQDERSFLMRWARWRNIQKRCRIAEQASPRAPGRILDVGCSTGVFLDAMRRSGWETHGVETSHDAVCYARQRLDLDVFEGTLSEADMSAGYFDVVTLWDVLEHTFNPLETLREVNRLLGDRGIVVMTLPHWESLDRKLFGREWIGYDVPRHLYVFPRSVLEQMLERAGFRTIRAWCGLSGYFTFVASVRLWLKAHVRTTWVREAIMRGLYFPGARLPVQPIFSLCERLGCGGTLIVLARKAEVVEESSRDTI